MSAAVKAAQASLTEAKSAFIDAAKAIDPLAPLRRRPFVTVGVAAGIGAVLGMNRGRIAAPMVFGRAISSLMRTGVFALRRYVVAKASHKKAEMSDGPARTPATN
jgi:hypothetical protein